MYFIFEVTIRPGHTSEQYADAWVRASRLIQQATGARGTRLHRKIGDPMTLVAIASWDSKDSRDAADHNLGDRLADVRAILREAATHAEIRIVGEFEEPEWVVLPEGVSGSGS